MTELPGKGLEPGAGHPKADPSTLPSAHCVPPFVPQGHTQHVAQWQVSLKLFRPFGARLSLSPDGTTPQRIKTQCCFSVSPSHLLSSSLLPLFSHLSLLSLPSLPSVSPSLLPLSPLSPFPPFPLFPSLSSLPPLSPTSYPLPSPLPPCLSSLSTSF